MARSGADGHGKSGFGEVVPGQAWSGPEWTGGARCGEAMVVYGPAGRSTQWLGEYRPGMVCLRSRDNDHRHY